jgi:hypothetical protein
MTQPEPSRVDLLDALEDVLNQACGEDGPDGKRYMDSMALSAYAIGLRTLEKSGRIRITKSYGRRVIAEWVPGADRIVLEEVSDAPQDA